MSHRELVIGDRVRITGPWHPTHDEGRDHVGKHATYVRPNENNPSTMPIDIHIDGTEEGIIYHWCRENLRALPRKTK